MGIHRTRLNWRRVGTEQDFFCDVESVLHITGWVIFWKVHTLEVCSSLVLLQIHPQLGNPFR